ncbi:uncharacterized protein LOC130766081 [Actinidia eriantha]|uniref:uncharacterized protein LOC130766081 n=1 Tax=Actinidia eriantha TaxID=165200 RepID=UPI0025862C93|nr:uncharacterized protein LOC130766081 [Actinidia eriantha]
MDNLRQVPPENKTGQLLSVIRPEPIQSISPAQTRKKIIETRSSPVAVVVARKSSCRRRRTSDLLAIAIARHIFLPSPLLVACCRRREFKRPSAAELSDFGCFIVLACGVSLLEQIDISLIYHMIRGQGTIELYVVYNVLENPET